MVQAGENRSLSVCDRCIPFATLPSHRWSGSACLVRKNSSRAVFRESLAMA
jgi:hypothetical protein